MRELFDTLIYINSLIFHFLHDIVGKCQWRLFGGGPESTTYLHECTIIEVVIECFFFIGPTSV